MNETIISLWRFLWQMTSLGLLVALVVLGVRLVWLLFFAKGKKTGESAPAAATLGEVIRRHRQSCRMTQEFVAEQLGVSRQAVSKWESGAADPSTANLLALAKLFQADAAEMLHAVAPKEEKA